MTVVPTDPPLPASRAAGALGAAALARPEDARALAQAIVDTIREPLLVLDKDLRVVAASRSFYQTFHMTDEGVLGRAVYALGDGEWNIPELRVLLEKILPEQAVMDGYEVDHDFIGIGRRLMLLNARTVFFATKGDQMILVAIEDVTAARAAAHDMALLLEQKEVLLEEMQHRVANSLQIIASILLLKARTVHSEETRAHLQDAHKRVMSVASVQQQLQASKFGELIDLGPYLVRLCETLGASMITDARPISLKVKAEGGAATSGEAVSIGLIVTELVINALRHAFAQDRTDAAIVVGYDIDKDAWRLSVSDNGGGKTDAAARPGLGTSIVEALAHQLEARVDIVNTPRGTKVSITHGIVRAPLPEAA
jgi:two-component sensor histidine kinase